jgi:hypothetical protein
VPTKGRGRAAKANPDRFVRLPVRMAFVLPSFLDTGFSGVFSADMVI